MKEFRSIGAFTRHLERLAALGEGVGHHIVAESTKTIQKAAQTKVGHYQESVGPFPDWAPLAESTKEDRVRHGYTADNPLLRDGTLRDSYTTAQDGAHGAVGSAEDVALMQEVGTSRIPPRPVLGPAAIESKSAIATRAGNTLIAWISGIHWKRAPQFLKSPTPGND